MAPARTVRLILSGFDSGRFQSRMGNGPGHLMACGLADRLVSEGWEVVPCILAHTDPFPTEIGTGFALQRLAAGAVRDAAAAGAFPLILAGNCNTAAIGALAGMGGERQGIVWLDAHGDFNTPESTETGFLDGMGLAMATGRCWASMTRRVPGFKPVDPRRVLLVGGHDLDASEPEDIPRSGMTHLTPEALRRDGSAAALAALATADAAYLHIDLDVHGREHGRVNDFQPAAGLSPREVGDLVVGAMAALPVRAAAVTAYNPACDQDGRIARIAVDLIATLLAAKS